MTMRHLFVSMMALAALVVPSAAADPTGYWRVEDGSAEMRVATCDGRLWGVVARTSYTGVDSKNPDPALRHRPILGLPIIQGMRQTRPNHWAGSIYNPRNGKTYDGTVSMTGPDVLEVSGCVLGGWVCGGQDWTRVEQGAGSTGSEREGDLCLSLFGTSRPAQEGGLK